MVWTPIPPPAPVPPPPGRVSRIPAERPAGPRWNVLQGFARYLRYRMLMRRRKNRNGKSSTPFKREKPPDIDTFA